MRDENIKRLEAARKQLRLVLEEEFFDTDDLKRDEAHDFFDIKGAKESLDRILDGGSG